ncbi:MAG: LpxI family protein [Paracoccaceae bacterium]
MTKTAIIAGAGALPGLLARRLTEAGEPFVLAELEGFPCEVPGVLPLRFRIERLVPFLEHLAREGVGRLVLAGSVNRPKIEPEAFDARTAQLVPMMLAAMRKGDDGALRALIGIFEDWDFEVVGADAVAPDLVPGEGILAGDVRQDDWADATRAAAIVARLGALDLGQGAVVAGGQCLGVETLPGTDAMLTAVAAWRGTVGERAGLLYKAPKPGQDRRADLPAIGPGTVQGAAAAGLRGIAWEAGGVIVLDRGATVAAAGRAGLFLWSRTP